jgi:proline iminopeptidase
MNLVLQRTILFLLLIGLLVISSLLFIPRSYNVPQSKVRQDIHYWDLTTGSKIAYTLIPAKGIKKPYPIIFLQGGPGGFYSDRTIELFKPFAEKGFDVYLYDQIGGGNSARLENIGEYTADRHKRDLEEIVKTIGSEKAILIGQSWGAILATLFLADNPGKVDRIIFTSPGPVQPIQTELANLMPPDSLRLREPQYSNTEANATVQNLRSKLVSKWALVFESKLASDKEVDDFQTLLNNKLNTSTVCDTSLDTKDEGGGGFYAQVMTLRSLSSVKDPRPVLKKSIVPVIIMKGQCDNQKWGFTNEYLQLFQNHKFVIIPNAGHSISLEQPDLYLKTISDFLID